MKIHSWPSEPDCRLCEVIIDSRERVPYNLTPLTKKDGKDVDRWLKTAKSSGGAGHKPSAAGKSLSFARGFLNEAVDAEIIAANPFRKMKADRTVDKSRQKFIAAETIEKVISLAPDAVMRAIIALSRWGGLRTPYRSLFALPRRARLPSA